MGYPILNSISIMVGLAVREPAYSPLNPPMVLPLMRPRWVAAVCKSFYASIAWVLINKELVSNENKRYRKPMAFPRLYHRFAAKVIFVEEKYTSETTSVLKDKYLCKPLPPAGFLS